MKESSRRVLTAPLFLALLTSTGSAVAQYGSTTSSFDTSEIDKMKETCLSIEQQQFYNDRMRANKSNTEVGGGATGWQAKHGQENQSRDINSGASNSVSNCDGVIRSYFQWKEAQLYADAMKANGLANADALKSTGLANADANKSVGLVSAAAMQSVGLANSKAQMYTGIAGAAGGLLGSLFTSGNQKAAVKLQADAEVEKAKIVAQVELEKARMQYDLMKGQGGGGGYQQPYQQRQYAQPVPAEAYADQQQYKLQQYTPQVNRQDDYRQSNPHQHISPQPYIQPLPQQVYQKRQYARPVPAEAYAYQQQYAPQQYAPEQYTPQMNRQDDYRQSNPHQHISHQPYIQPLPQQNYQVAAISTVSAISRPSSQSSSTASGLRKYIASIRLIEDPSCDPGSVIIMSSASPRICAFPSSIMPGGSYTFDGTKLVKY